MESLQNKIKNKIERIISFCLKWKNKFFKSKLAYSTTLLVIFFIILGFIANILFEYYVKKNYVNIYQIKSQIVSFIRKNFLKAIEIGIVDFSSTYGIIFEDIKISQEEDFSNNKFLFTSKRIDVKLTSFFSKNLIPSKIIIYGGKVTIDIDDLLISNVAKFILELNLPDIQFENLEVTIRAGNDELLQTSKPISVLLKRKKNNLEVSMNDRSLLGLIPGTIDGKGNINLETDENFFQIRFSEHHLENLSGISKNLLNLTPDSGFADGFISLDKTAEDFKIDGNLNFRKFSGEFFPISNIKANDFTINAKFSYLKQFKENNVIESYFKRRISSPQFYYDEQTFTPANKLRKTTVSIQVDSFKNLQKRLILEDEFSILGTMKLNLRIEETGKALDWLWIEGGGELSNFEFNNNVPELNLSNANLHFLWNKNELQAKITGNLFDKKFHSDVKGNIAFNKSNKDSIMTLNSNLKMNFDINSIVLKSFNSIYNSLSGKVIEDIRERQEKMLPESFFIQSYLYKAFLEKANVNSNIRIADIKFRDDSHSLGKHQLVVKLESSLANLSLKGGLDNDNEMNLNIYLDRKYPSIDFRTNISSLFWFDELIEICDSRIYSDIIDFNMTFISSGNNFSELLVNRSINGEMRLRGNSFIRSNPGDNINLSDFFIDQKKITISLGFNSYSQDGFLRNIEIKSNEGLVRGNANLVRAQTNFFFQGQIKNTPLNLSFIKAGASCQKVK